MSDLRIFEVAIGMIVLGFVVALVATIMLANSKRNRSRNRVAGILLIGPIPIMFGTDRESVRVLVILAAVLMAIVLLSLLLPSILSGK